MCTVAPFITTVLPAAFYCAHSNAGPAADVQIIHPFTQLYRQTVCRQPVRAFAAAEGRGYKPPGKHPLNKPA